MTTIAGGRRSKMSLQPHQGDASDLTPLECTRDPLRALVDEAPSTRGGGCPFTPPTSRPISPPIAPGGIGLGAGWVGLLAESVLARAMAAEAPIVGLGIIAVKAREAAASLAPKHVHAVALAA